MTRDTHAPATNDHEDSGSDSARLPEGLIDAVRERLSQSERLRRTLPHDGRLHIDRPLPFLVVYRAPADRDDPGTRRLAVSQASYLTISGAEEMVAPARELVRTVVEVLSETHGAFLLVEIWTAVPDQVRPPVMRVVAPDQQGTLEAISELSAALGEIVLDGQQPDVRTVQGKSASPPGMEPLVGPEEANQLRCFMVGVEIDPMFRGTNGVLYPSVVRDLAGQLSDALQRLVFAFSREKTSIDAPVYHRFGRRAVVRAVRRVDDALGDLCASFDFLLGVTPVDSDEAWTKFENSGFSEPPSFRYRSLTSDPELMLRQLYAVPLEDIEDPTLDRLFREKVREVARQFTMLSERNTHRFLHGSLQLYGGVDTELLRLAEGLLATIGTDLPGETGTVDAEAFAEMASDSFDQYREQDGDFDATMSIRDDLSGLMVSKGALLIPKSLSLTEQRAEALLHHEVGTHVVSWFNGRGQPLQIFRTGLAGYEELQEGLAVLAEFLVGGLNRRRLSILALRVVAVDRMIQGNTFLEIFHELVGDYGVDPRSAYTTTMRVTRGGGLTKDAVYLRGLRDLLRHLGDDGDLEVLFNGKFALRHVPVVQELLHRGVLDPPPLRPACLDVPGAAERLADIRDGVRLVELLNREN